MQTALQADTNHRMQLDSCYRVPDFSCPAESDTG